MVEPVSKKTPSRKRTRTRTRKRLFTDTQLQILATTIVGIVVGLGQTFQIYMASRTATEIKSELNINSEGLGTKLDNIETTGNKTHSIVNSGSVAQDKVLATTAQTLAEITKKPDDILAAQIALDQYKRNLVQQKIIDDKVFIHPSEEIKQPEQPEQPK